jgi:truncated hemoglobin YjbI
MTSIEASIESPGKPSLYDQIGHAFLSKAVAEFYQRAFADVMIGHFFYKSDIEHITRQQIQFASAMLGGPQSYKGLALKLAHKPFLIRPVHFNRRQVLMREVLNDLGLDAKLCEAWLAAEDQFRQVIVNHH